MKTDLKGSVFLWRRIFGRQNVVNDERFGGLHSSHMLIDHQQYDTNVIDWSEVGIGEML